MEDYILNNDETFYEFPDGLLEIKNDSDLYLIVIDNIKYVVREKIILTATETINNKLCIKYMKNYYNVIDNEMLKSIIDTYSMDSNEMIFTNYEGILINLSQILNIKGNEKAYLDIDDVSNLVGFKETKSNNPRKSYF